MIRIKSYNSWNTYKSKKHATQELTMAIACCEGAERERYVYALIRLNQGCSVIDTDYQK
jgi:hypothetical protein